ncbi:DUF4157 domain-containing protein [Dinoroseobacter sp. PD6]|uniref:eCIS core domain-containing protein n=2 Tax=Pseudomonadota TaxID=1224 RepID=UPI00237B1427|nr:DUF4157 domain-containing protein [Dinoroseobacter sp. PD6]MDD9717755.1 DUF4157 domain-containing protein [Dinoroseobacter sp. PD6]
MLTHAKTREPKTTGAPVTARGRAAPVRPCLEPGLIQRAATLGKRDDVYEREAERVAKAVSSGDRPEPVSMAAPSGVPQRLTETDAEAERPGEYLIQPSREGAQGGEPPLRKGFLQRLLELRRGGRPLPDTVRSEMEARIGEDFSDVRIHTGREASDLAAEIHARAFTVGRDVVFAGDSFAPATLSGRHLIAHELTHVVQQRGPRADSAVAQAAPGGLQRDVSDYIPDLPDVGSIVMGLVRDYAPRLAPILDKGPFNWLTDQLAGVFSGVIDKVTALDPGQHVTALVETFGRMVESAAEIIGALVTGDCGPMMAALGRMKVLVLEVAGKAWDKTKAFFAPVGAFFSDLWSSVSAAGSAAITWIKEFAGEIWTGIEEIGAYIWDKTKTIRDYGMGAWDWLSEKLFGASDAGKATDGNGVLGLITDKAMEAWDWVKARTRPVWEPVNEAIETVNELIPPEFVADLGEKMTSFADDVESTADELDQGNSLAENREALSGVLPSLDRIITTVRGVIEGAGSFLTTTIGKVAGKVTSFMTKLRSSDLVSGLASALGWLETAIEDVSGWAADKVGTLFEWYLKAFDFLSPFVKQLIEIAGKVVEIAVDILLLPKLLLTKAWDLIPECIREPIKSFVLDTVLAQVPIFNQLLKIGGLWKKVQEVAFEILASIFAKGDILKAAWTFFKEMLALIGLPAKLVVQILAKAARAYGMILRNPIGFLINLLKAMKEGFTLFFDNILTHLMNGVVGWLTGAVSAAGLSFPTELTFQAVLDFVLQLLDITVERVLERLEKKIGKEKVAKIRKALDYADGVWEFIRVIVTEGVGGLWRFIQEKLSNLWSMVLQSTIGWVVEKIITEATVKILSFLDPSGIMAVINSCIAIYRAIETFVQQLKAMLQIVSKVLNGIVGIAKGAIDVAAGFLEKAMADSLPVAIAFLADQVGLGDLSDRIKEFVEGLRDLVNSAIDWLIDKALKFGQGFLKLVESGVDLAKAGVRKLKDWWTARTDFKTTGGEPHSISIEGQGRNAKVILRSTPVTYADWIADTSNFTLDTPKKQKAYQDAVVKSGELDAAISAAASNPSSATPEATDATQGDHGPKIQALVNELGDLTSVFMPNSATKDEESSPPIYGGLYKNKYGTSVTVQRLTNQVPKGGTAASGRGDRWTELAPRGTSPGSPDGYYVRGHLLNQKLGGPGAKWENLTILTQDANNREKASHEKKFESKVKDAVIPDAGTIAPKAVNFVCTVNYGREDRVDQADRFLERTTPAVRSNRLSIAQTESIARIIRAETDVPFSMDCSAFELNDDGAKKAELVTFRVQNPIKTDDKDYYVKSDTAKPTLNMNTANRNQLKLVYGIGDKTVDKFFAIRTARMAKSPPEPFESLDDLKALKSGGAVLFNKIQIEELPLTYKLQF